MLGEPLGRGKKLHKILGHVHGLDGADAQPLDGGLIQDSTEQVFELNARRKLAAVGAEIDPAQDDFAIARLAEFLELSNYGVRRQAAALPANKGNHAKRTTRIAAILNLESRSRVIPFPAKDGSSEQCLLLEDVSDQDFRWLPQFRLRYRRNRRERKKAARTGKSRMRRNRFDELWNLRFVRIADITGQSLPILRAS